MEDPNSVIIISKAKIRYYFHYILAILIFIFGVTSLIFPAASCKDNEIVGYILTWGKLLCHYGLLFYRLHNYSVILPLFGILTVIFILFWVLRWKSLTKQFILKITFAFCFLIYIFLVIYQISIKSGWMCYHVGFGLISLFLEVIWLVLDIVIEQIPVLRYDENH